MQLLFFDVFTRGVGDLDGAWPDEHGLSPIAEGGNVRGECRYHGRNANESMQADKGNLERKVYFHQTARVLNDLAPKFVGGTDQPIE